MNKKQATVAGAALASFGSASAGVIDADTGNLILVVLNLLSALLPSLIASRRDASRDTR